MSKCICGHEGDIENFKDFKRFTIICKSFNYFMNVSTNDNDTLDIIVCRKCGTIRVCDWEL